MVGDCFFNLTGELLLFDTPPAVRPARADTIQGYFLLMKINLVNSISLTFFRITSTSAEL